MRLVLRADPVRIRKAFSLACSVGLHGAALGWALLPATPGREPSAYQLQIQPHATRIVWYSLKQTLPPISPAEQPHDPQPVRALTRSLHTMVAGKQDLLRPPQLIWTPAPPLAEPRLLPSPNIVALTPPARPQPRAFVPPPLPTNAAPAKAPVPVLPAAPELAAALQDSRVPRNLLPPAERARKAFIPPVEAVHQPRSTPLNLPAAPALAMTTPERVLLTTPVAKPVREFHPPEPARQPVAAPPPAMPNAPQIAAEKRTDASLAIVGLVPTRRPEIPTPTASQEAGFSAGPQPRPIGSNDAADPSQIVIPGLLARSGAPTPTDRESLLASAIEPPTSMRNLLAAARSLPLQNDHPGSRLAMHVTESPDPRLNGRIVYSMALQMPNVTSFSGSWLVWFAERGAAIQSRSSTPPPGLTPPSPIRKVDPKYIPAAREERIEGAVRLAAIIRKDGSVDTVEVLHSLDSRLDRSAAEALAKWEFEPALRDGAPIEVDAVFEIPFHLAPRAANERPSP